MMLMAFMVLSMLMMALGMGYDVDDDIVASDYKTDVHHIGDGDDNVDGVDDDVDGVVALFSLLSSSSSL